MLDFEDFNLAHSGTGIKTVSNMVGWLLDSGLLLALNKDSLLCVE